MSAYAAYADRHIGRNFICRLIRLFLSVVSFCFATSINRSIKYLACAHRQVIGWSPVSIQTQSLALRALRKRKPQETQALALASSQSWLSLLRPSIPIGWRLRLLREISCGFRLRARNASDYFWMETGHEFIVRDHKLKIVWCAF